MQFHSLDVSEEDTIGDLLMYINTTIQYGKTWMSEYPGWVHTHLHSLPFRMIQPRPLVLLTSIPSHTAVLELSIE